MEHSPDFHVVVLFEFVLWFLTIILPSYCCTNVCFETRFRSKCYVRGAINVVDQENFFNEIVSAYRKGVTAEPKKIYLLWYLWSLSWYRQQIGLLFSDFVFQLFLLWSTGNTYKYCVYTWCSTLRSNNLIAQQWKNCFLRLYYR